MNAVWKTFAVMAAITIAAMGFCTLFHPLHCLDVGWWSKQNRLQTRPEQGFVIYGDTRSKPGTHRRIVDEITSRNPSFVINTGDLVANGANPDQWNTFASIIDPLQGDYFPVIGNHERWANGGKSYILSRFPEIDNHGYYDFTRAGIHFVMINQYVPYGEGSEQYSWFRDQIDDDEPSYTPTIVCLHEPHFTASQEHSGDPTTKTDLVPLIEKENVDAVFYGHSHLFGTREQNDVIYVIAAGGAAPLYNPVEENMNFSRAVHHFVFINKDNSRLNADVISKTGELIYEFNISIGEPI